MLGRNLSSFISHRAIESCWAIFLDHATHLSSFKLQTGWAPWIAATSSKFSLFPAVFSTDTEAWWPNCGGKGGNSQKRFPTQCGRESLKLASSQRVWEMILECCKAVKPWIATKLTIFLHHSGMLEILSHRISTQKLRDCFTFMMTPRMFFSRLRL